MSLVLCLSHKCEPGFKVLVNPEFWARGRGTPLYGLLDRLYTYIGTDLPTPITCKSGGFEKQAQKNLEIRTSKLENSKICVK